MHKMQISTKAMTILALTDEESNFYVSWCLLTLELSSMLFLLPRNLSIN